MRPLAVHQVSVSCDPPASPSADQLAGHTYFHAHNRSSSDMEGAVIYGARSLSVHAGNSNTWEDRGDWRGRAHPAALSFTFTSLLNSYEILASMHLWCLHKTSKAVSYLWMLSYVYESIFFAGDAYFHLNSIITCRKVYKMSNTVTCCYIIQLPEKQPVPQNTNLLYVLYVKRNIVGYFLLK